MFPAPSRVPCHQPSSMLTYAYPASLMPDATIASACCRITLALICAAKLFQGSQPIGGLAIDATAAGVVVPAPLALAVGEPTARRPAARTAPVRAWAHRGIRLRMELPSCL